MHRMIVCSDSHGASKRLSELEAAYPEAEAFVHLGDLEDQPGLFPKWIFVRGNNDWSMTNVPSERIIKFCGHRILITHSHHFPYAGRERAMAATARENDCDMVLYGHTHRSNMETINDVFLMNPGSILQPRDGKDPSYGIIDFNDDGTYDARIVFKPDWPFEPEPVKYWW